MITLVTEVPGGAIIFFDVTIRDSNEFGVTFAAERATDWESFDDIPEESVKGRLFTVPNSRVYCGSAYLESK